ncbi:hypothetical protein G3479_02920 [Shewanella baltica]|uniref:hypothetical protein n=1 Tax=Shewanella baltica TaxID=62322 RepID=UPI00217D24A2|nr:hypothetical protein [Shewanella baltica]MCS6258222.1 hypothetical protein [Shewanella baltica]
MTGMPSDRGRHEKLSELFSLVFFCDQAIAGNSLSQAQIEAISPYLLSAVAETPYFAVIRHTDAKVIEGTDGSQHIFYAEVTDTIRGEHRDRIHYAMSAEPDEALSLDDAEVLITLCINDFQATHDAKHNLQYLSRIYQRYFYRG